MAEIVKFHEKNVAIYTDIESSSGVYQTGIAAVDAVAATAISGNVTYETNSFQFLTDPLSRDEFSYTKDTYAELSIDAPVMVLGKLNTALPVTSVPYSDFLRACGGAVTVNGSTGVVTIDNSTAEDSTISVNYTKTSLQDSVNFKLLKFFGIRGTVDVSANVTEIPTFKFNLKGNAYPPIESPKIVPDFGTQFTQVAAPIRLATIVSSQITPYGENFNAQSTISGTPTITKSGAVATVTLTSHGLTDGRLVNISGATDALYNGDWKINYVDANTFTYVMNGTPASNASGTLVAKKDGYSKAFCFDKLSAPNFFGFEFTRYLTACEEGFSKTAVPSDVSLTVLEGVSPSFAITSISRVAAVATVTVDTTAHGLATGNSVTVYGATGTDGLLYNGTFVITVTGANTFTYTMGGTPSGAAAGNLSYINNSSTTLDPIANLGNNFAAILKFGTGAGKYVTLKWDKMQLTNAKEGKVGSFFGYDLTFRNTGKSYIVLE